MGRVGIGVRVLGGGVGLFEGWSDVLWVYIYDMTFGEALEWSCAESMAKAHARSYGYPPALSDYCMARRWGGCT